MSDAGMNDFVTGDRLGAALLRAVARQERLPA
jgi:hypothetical protein